MQISNVAEACAFCQELVRCPGLSGQEQGVAELVEREMAMLGYDEVRRDGLGNVVGMVRGARPGRTVLVDAHMDTVPVTTPQLWRYGPYAGEIIEGRIWGRGATDVKGSLAAAVVAIGTLQRSTLAGTLVMAATVGEEMVEGVALAQVLKNHPAERVVICEPTGLRLGIGHRGRTMLVLSAEGLAVHSSRPELGVNAVYRLMEAVACLRRLPLPCDEALGAGVMELVEIISSPFPGTTMVPSACTARFDRRLLPSETRAGVLAEARAALAHLKGIEVHYQSVTLSCFTGVTFEVDDFHAAWSLPPRHEMVRCAQEALAHAGLCAELYLAPYSSNGAASAGELGLPTLLYGAGEIENAHIVDETLRVTALEQAFHGYQALARALSAGSR